MRGPVKIMFVKSTFRGWSYAGLMLGRRLRRRPNIIPAQHVCCYGVWWSTGGGGGGGFTYAIIILCGIGKIISSDFLCDVKLNIC